MVPKVGTSAGMLALKRRNITVRGIAFAYTSKISVLTYGAGVDTFLICGSAEKLQGIENVGD